MLRKVRVQLYSLTCGYPLFSARSVERLSFRHWVVLAPLLKSFHHICEHLFLGFLVRAMDAGTVAS